MFEAIDFSPGTITYDATDDPGCLKEEDIFQVSYLNGKYILDLGWYRSNYAIKVIKDMDWTEPLLEKECTDPQELEQLCKNALIILINSSKVVLYQNEGDVMFQVNSYLLKPDRLVTDLKDLLSNPREYFVDITDLKGLNEIRKGLDFQYLNGTICLKYCEEILLDPSYWDLIDPLWAYLVNVVDDVLHTGEGSVYFPDQPVKITLRQTSGELLLLTIEDREASSFVLPKDEFLNALVNGAEQFFVCMTRAFRSDCDYAHELEKIESIKQRLRY